MLSAVGVAGLSVGGGARVVREECEGCLWEAQELSVQGTRLSVGRVPRLSLEVARLSVASIRVVCGGC